MSKIDITTPATVLADGMLQTANPLDATLQVVTDNVGNSSKLLLSTTEVQVNSTLRINTDNAEILDIQDTAANNRFNINRSVQKINLDFASMPADLTTQIGTIRTAIDGINLADVVKFQENGQVTFTERVKLESDSTVTTQTSSVIQSSTLNANLVISPNGTGALVANIPDGLVAGGNARGSNAVDLQTTRTAATNIATGVNSTISGGASNTASSNYSTVSGGQSNTASTNTHATVVGGQSNTASGQHSVVSGGSGNTAGGIRSAIGGGQSNIIGAGYTVIGGGLSNTNNTDYATIGGGTSNAITNIFATASVISGGQGNSVLGGGGQVYQTIGGGLSNTTSVAYATVSGGQSNVASSNTHATVVGGQSNTASGEWSIAGGNGNTSSGQGGVALGWGNSNSGFQGSVSLGYQNVNSGNVGALALGYNNTNSGFGTISLGSSHITSNQGVCIGAENRSNITAGLALGYRSSSYLYAQNTLGSGYFAAQGDAQQSLLTARRSSVLTTGGTTVLSLDGTGVTNLIIPLGNNRAWNVTIKTIAIVTTITGTATGVTVGDVYSENKYLLFKRIGGVSSIVGTVDTSNIKSDASMNTAAVTITAGASQEMAITFTAPTFVGGGSVTCRIVSRIELSEVAY